MNDYRIRPETVCHFAEGGEWAQVQGWRVEYRREGRGGWQHFVFLTPHAPTQATVHRAIEEHQRG